MKYRAFITYSHANERQARRLQNALENYRVPRKLVGLPSSDGPVPNNLKPVFRDRTDLRGGPDLSREIASALRESQTLVVLCSPSAVASRWVNQEIREFQNLGRQDKIFAAIVDPGPRGSPTDAMPSVLRHRAMPDGSVVEIEPLAADFRKDGFGNAKLKLVAGILGIDFDALKQREKNRRLRRLATVLSAGIGALLAVVFVYIGLADKGAPIWAGAQLRRFLDEHDISWFRHAPALAEIDRKASAVRSKLIPPESTELEQAATLDPNGTILSVAPDGRLGGSWELGQTVTGIAGAPESTAGDLASAKRAIELLFEPGRPTIVNGVRYGWLRYKREHPQGEAALWPIVAISTLLSRPSAVTPEERERFVQHLEFAEGAASLYYDNGGWMNLPNQVDRKKYGLYTTLIGLRALLAVREAHQQWPGRDLDQMITSTASYLLASYDDKGDWAKSPGWHGIGQMRDVTPIDTLTLFSYALLLRTSEALPDKIRIPDAMIAAMRERADQLESGTIEPFITDQDQFETRFVDLDGKEKDGGYTWKYPWYPYAVLFTKAWFDHLQASHADPAQVVEARRALARVVDFAPNITTRGDFYRAENLFSLNAIQ